MTSDGVSEVGSMEGQLASKYRGWKELQTLVHQLERSLQKAQEECSSLRKKYYQLREDFQFNLAILDERDRELERYDAITAKALAVNNKRQEELSHLSLLVTKLEKQRATEAEEWQIELCKSQHDVAQYRLQLDDLKDSLAGEMREQTQEYERTKWNLEHKIQELEEKLNMQRQEMTASFDTEVRQREHELNLKIDEMHTVLLSHNLKMKLLSKKTEIYNQAYLQTREALRASKQCCLQLQTELNHRDQEVKTLVATKDNRIKELEDKIKLMKTKLKKEEEHHNKHIRDVSNEMITLQKRETKLKIEVEKSQEAIDRYKQQLSDGLTRERTLEQKRVQVELEWQRRCEDIKAKHYLATEQLIQDLTQARDQAQAELKEKNQELQDLTVLVHSVQTERDQAKQDSSSKPDCASSEEIRHLQEQNSILRAAVTQMRKDMESLSHLNQTQASCATPPSQVITDLPNQSTTGSSKVSPADDLIMKTQPNTCDPTKEEARVEHTESNIIDQNTLVQKLLEHIQHLHHQQASGPLSGGLFQSSQPAKSNHPLMHSRLKQAASCIARLCQEKQQLIEMANRLRATNTAPGPQEPVEPEKDSSPHKQGDQHDQLSSLLGQLQYQLTTQELQYALRQRVCTINEQPLPGPSNQRASTSVAASSWPQGHNTADRSEHKEKSSLVCLSQNPASIHPNSGLPQSQLSSESMQSLKELWETLDHRLSSSIVSEGDDDLSCRDSAGVQMVVHGYSAPIHRPNLNEAKPKMNLSRPLAGSTKISKPGAPGRTAKIRNYNVKD
ncbi:coiled-coil domain-containing protein 57 isoform X2 [Betta splendens]|uniref:Coiled-coil domain-containing protein 57 isoform X2 n=1 Tax=Betta splendens TaxID=158456 RepID=A0A6P7LCN1_BETSP|nr:coiled-coil domain-containing protein 57 isoform X2 [Betta splendens]